MNGRKRSIAAPGGWLAAPVLLGACSFMAPSEREYSGGAPDAGHGPGGSALGTGGTAQNPVAIKQGPPSGGSSSMGGFPGVGAGGGSSSTHPIGKRVFVDAGSSILSPDAAPVEPPGDARAPLAPADSGAPLTCGGLSCAAPFATATCVDSQCQRACVSGYADCNHDLALGASGSGCETHTAADVANCGACGAPCALGNQDAVFCSTSLCKRYAVSVAPGATGPLHGGDGGAPFSMPCGANEVVVGLHGLVGSDSVYGLGADCAALEIHPNGTSYAMAVVPTSQLAVVGGYPSTQTDQTSFSVSCPAGTVVTAVSGATWPPWGDDRVCVKALTLTCTALSIDSARKVTLGTASSTISAGKQDATSTAFAADKCAGLGVVRGFTGSNGNLIDNLSTQCGVISLATQTQTKTSKGAWTSNFANTLTTVQ